MHPSSFRYESLKKVSISQVLSRRLNYLVRYFNDLNNRPRSGQIDEFTGIQGKFPSAPSLSTGLSTGTGDIIYLVDLVKTVHGGARIGIRVK